MINLTRLDLIRGVSQAIADELSGVRDQINSQPSVLSQTYTATGVAGTAAALPATPSGYVEIVINGVAYVLPFYAKA